MQLHRLRRRGWGANPGERGDPIIDLGKTIDVSFSLEASGELHAISGNGNGIWGSDTAIPIVGYQLGVPEPSAFALALVAMASVLCRTPSSPRLRRGVGHHSGTHRPS